MHYSVDTALTGIHRISLPQPEVATTPFDQPSNAYLLTGDGEPVLINTGHREARPALLEALHTLDTAVEDIQKVVLTGVWPDIYGNADVFPYADIYAIARPHRISTWLRQRVALVHNRLTDATAELAQHHQKLTVTAQPFLDQYFHSPPRLRNLVPVQNGFALNLAGHVFRVIQAPGTILDNIGLYDPVRGVLFSGDAVQNQHEACWITDTDAVIDTAVDLFQLNAARLLPNRGQPSIIPNRLIKRMSLFVNNFLANAPFATDGPTTSPELVIRDIGLDDEISVHYVALALGYRALLDELFRNELVQKAGDGLFARFGMEP